MPRASSFSAYSAGLHQVIPDHLWSRQAFNNQVLQLLRAAQRSSQNQAQEHRGKRVLHFGKGAEWHSVAAFTRSVEAHESRFRWRR